MNFPGTMRRILAAVGLAAWLAAPASPAADLLKVPDFPRQFVGLPEFVAGDTKKVGATAFAVKVDGDPQVWLLTVRHRLGDFDPARVTQVFFKSFFGAAPLSLAVTSLPIPASSDTTAPLADLTVFRVDSFPSEEAVPLAAADPQVGDNVWVVARVKSDSPEDRPLHVAKVSAVPGNDPRQWLVADFYSPDIDSWGAGGAPVVDASGKIVGIHSIHRTVNGQVKALIIPVSLIRAVIAGQQRPL
jgi:hypothetical protein